MLAEFLCCHHEAVRQAGADILQVYTDQGFSAKISEIYRELIDTTSSESIFMDIDSCYKIGYIAKTHGLKGEVTIVVIESIPRQKTVSVLIEVKGILVPYFIESISDRGDKAFVKFEGVDNPEQAKALKGCSLFLPKKVRPPLGRGEFYDDEVIGFEVEDDKLGLLGEVREVVQIGPNRLLAIDRHDKELLIPVQGPFIQNVNKSKKKVRVDLPEGFLDI